MKISILAVVCMMCAASSVVTLLVYSQNCSKCGWAIPDIDWEFNPQEPYAKTVYVKNHGTPTKWDVMFRDSSVCHHLDCGQENEAGKQTHTFGEYTSVGSSPYEWGDGANVTATPFTGNKQKYTCTVTSESAD